MYKTLFILFICLFLKNVNAQGKLEISHLTGDFYIYTTYVDYEGTPYPANSMYAVTPEGVVMIDTPWDTLQVKPLLDSIKARHGKDVVMCIATHFHDDRTGGFDILKRLGIRTYSTRHTYELCKETNRPLAEYIMAADTAFNVGGMEFETYFPGAGHAPDNIVVWFPGEQILYGGCFIKSTDAGGLGNLSHADTKSWEIAVEKVMAKYTDAKFIIPGHEGWRDLGSLKYTYELLKEANGMKKEKNYKEKQFEEK
ncbi:MAG TPA: BlaB/IND/MUS family subclass B1 metallo-beta-lactamase [Ignavibacteria bacterium]|nr:BlaB/IND/MUS family subclass B1 metallo-beta-lactamase [Ignavibacteria bacterium]HMQ98981.1 BlaB/IND/MUS family subclass B1 metallo-beta-lactamase [Ignavibacteria bacterium]